MEDEKIKNNNKANVPKIMKKKEDEEKQYQLTNVLGEDTIKLMDSGMWQLAIFGVDF